MKILGTSGKSLRKLLTNFENVLEYWKMLMDFENVKDIHWKIRKNIEKFQKL